MPGKAAARPAIVIQAKAAAAKVKKSGGRLFKSKVATERFSAMVSGIPMANPATVSRNAFRPTSRRMSLVWAPLPVLYAGPAPTLVSGVQQVNLQIPQNLPDYVVTSPVGPTGAITLQAGPQPVYLPAFIK
jgi:uncharacterized protein (TIGR03437 family)